MDIKHYLQTQVHPLTVAECLYKKNSDLKNISEIQLPSPISDEAWQNLIKFGGFPEPFLRCDTRFWQRWKSLRMEQLIREDVCDLSRIQEIGQIQIFAELLKEQAGQLIVYSNLANEINASVDTIRRWFKTLESLYYCFSIKPWYKNVSRSLRKQPKVYLWDWSVINDPGAQAENFVASHLLKAVHFWTDIGLGDISKIK